MENVFVCFMREVMEHCGAPSMWVVLAWFELAEEAVNEKLTKKRITVRAGATLASTRI